MTTDKEKLEHLLAGGKLIHNDNKNILALVDDCFHWLGNVKAPIPVVLFIGKVTSPELGNCEIYREPKWYEEMPITGTLVKLVDANHIKVDIIHKYRPKDIVPLEGMHGWYKIKDVIPLTNEEIQKYFFR
jgi:hypothetical protein